MGYITGTTETYRGTIGPNGAVQQRLLDKDGRDRFARRVDVKNSGSGDLSVSTNNGRTYFTVAALSSWSGEGTFDQPLHLKSVAGTTWEVVALLAA